MKRLTAALAAFLLYGAICTAAERGPDFYAGAFAPPNVGNPTPVVVTDANGNTLTVSGIAGSASGTKVGNPTPVVLTDANGNVLTLSSSGGGLVPAVSNFPSGMMAWYRMLPTETPASLVDSSGNSLSATGTVGTAPTIISATGGINCTQNGAVILPSSLNSALTIMLMVNYNGNSNSQAINAPIAGNGNGATGNNIDLVFSGAGGVAGQLKYSTIQTIGNGVFKATVTAMPNGTSTYTLAMSTSDIIYIDGKQYTNIGASPSAGLQTTGAYQLCGTATGSGQPTPLYMLGKVYQAAFWNRVLTAAEVQAAHNLMATDMANRGVAISHVAPDTGVDLLAISGDSIAGGTGGSGTNPTWATSMVLTGAPNINNGGIAGALAANLVPGAVVMEDGIFRPTASRNTTIFFGGGNDIAFSSLTGQQTFTLISQYCRQRRALLGLGWKAIIGTLPSRTGIDAARDTFNNLVRQNWSTIADGILDIAANPSIGADAANASALYFQVDNVHPAQTSATNIMAVLGQRSYNMLYGNHDFSSATVYASAAPAAAAVTAATEATNTMTFTTAASTWAVGQCATVTGVTPAGYNSTAANGAGIGCWNILTTNGTTSFTAFNPTTGLGALSVAGTASVPQQRDADQVYIINFGAGNTTLETCQGITGQNISIRNINAASSTLVPLGSETITGGGATPTTIAANTTAILQSVLVSAAAAGCNWARIQ